MNLRHKHVLNVVFLILALVLAGCYQGAGGGETTPIAQVLPTDTPIPPTATNTLIPTNTSLPPTNTPVATNTQAAPLAAVTAQSAGSDTQANVAPTTVLVPTLPPVTQVAQFATPTQAGPTLDAFALTGTAFVQQATAAVEFMMTSTAQALGIGIPPTATPTPFGQVQPQTPVFGATTDPFQQNVFQGDCIHEVRAEDRNLFRISLRYGVPVRDIANASGITNINLITVGQRLVIPGCGTTGATPPPTSTPQVTLVPTTFGAVGTPGAAAVPAQPQTTFTGGVIHVVEQGETLFEISLRYGVPVRDIANANGITDINRIYLGQELVIP